MAKWSILLSTRAGDKFDLRAQSYWVTDPPTGSQYYDDVGTVVSQLVSTLAGGSPGASFDEGTVLGYSGAVSNSLAGNLEAVQTIMNNATVPGVPRVYIMYLVFDQNMTLVPTRAGRCR